MRNNDNREEDAPPKEELYDIYWNQNYSLVDIGKKYNVSNVTVAKWFKQHSIPKRGHSENQKLVAVPKIEVTNMSKYGLKSFFSSKENQTTYLQSRLDKYGCLYPSKQDSVSEKHFMSWINSLTENQFLPDVSVLKTREIDGYNKNLRIGFEFSGLYWHNENMKNDVSYHIIIKNIKIVKTIM